MFYNSPDQRDRQEATNLEVHLEEMRNRAERLAQVFRPRLEGSIQLQDIDREVAAFLADMAKEKLNS